MKKRVEQLRELMKKNGMDFYIIPSSDPHMSEYLPARYKSRAWVSSFTGSAGTLVVGLEEAGLWTDGRYFIQAERQLKDTGIELYKMRVPNEITIIDFLKQRVSGTSTVGFDGRLLSESYVRQLRGNVLCNYIIDQDLVDELWSDRPELPKDKAFIHDIAYAGLSTLEKINQVKEKLSADNYLIGSLDDICWLYNIRAFDISNNPVLVSYALLADKNYLFTDVTKVSHLDLDGIEVLPYDEVTKVLAQVKGSVYIDPARVNHYVASFIPKESKLVEGRNITTTLKAMKNQVEIKNLKNCQRKDGVAMTKFLHWMDQNDGVTELEAEAKLLSFRKEQPDFIQNSFDYISAYKENAAMMHYKSTTESNALIEKKGYYLIDSGGQYMDGTTDITRTLPCGELTEEERIDYTLVLKGHIALSNAVFLEGTTGSKLDLLARQPIWKYNMDYKCGTGHGVGYLLNVHEGPHGFSMFPNTVALEPGMIITNEPGIYKENRHGIRIENTLLVKPYSEGEFGKFYHFETISYCPIDLRPVVKEMLTSEEVDWLNKYHEMVLNELKPFIQEEYDWVKQITTL